MKNFDFEKELNDTMSKMDFSNEPSSKLNSILQNLKKFANSNAYSPESFKQQITSEFGNFNFKSFSDFAKTSKKLLLDNCSSRKETLHTINELLSLSQPAMDFMNNIEELLSK